MSRLGALHLTQSTGQKHTGTVIFFHGSGSSGADIKEWVRLMVANFSFPQIKVLYPTAPLQPYSPVGGQMSKVWFDRACISPNVPEKLESITQIEAEVKNLIKKENDAGIPSNRIIIVPPLLQIHGDNDDLVDLSWAKETFNLLKEHGVQGEFHIMERLGHSLNKRGVRLIKDWIEKNLPEI